MKNVPTEDLESRVIQYQNLSLPGQPRGFHMGTTYLIMDLWDKVVELLDNAKVDADE